MKKLLALLALALVACQTPSERLRTGDLLFVGPPQRHPYQDRG